MNRPIDCRSLRRFGVELELNTLNGIITKASRESREIPNGADYIAAVVRSAATSGNTEIACWNYIHNNNNWVIKHDTSCGLEINTPVFKGWTGLKNLIGVVDALSKYKKIKSNHLCSMHVHVDIGELNKYQLASVIAHYIKCEHIFFDSVPAQRKHNRYCQLIGMTDWFDTTFDMEPMEIISRVSQSKYGSLNTFHFVRGGGFTDLNDRRTTIEFRIAENAACLDPYFVKNWVRLLLHFVDITKNMMIPLKHNGYPRNGLAWLDFNSVCDLLEFNKQLSPGLKQVRQWFMDRIYNNGYDTGLTGIWSNTGRDVSRRQFLETYSKLERINDTEDGLYGKQWIE